MCKSRVFDNWVRRTAFRFIPLSTETIKFTSLCDGQLFVIPHYLQREIACADIHKRLTVMRIHVNQAVICKDKTKDKLFKKHGDYFNAYPCSISMQSSSKSLTSAGLRQSNASIFSRSFLNSNGLNSRQSNPVVQTHSLCRRGGCRLILVWRNYFYKHAIILHHLHMMNADGRADVAGRMYCLSFRHHRGVCCKLLKCKWVNIDYQHV